MPADWNSIRDAWHDRRPAPPPHRAWSAPLLPMPPTRRQRVQEALNWVRLALVLLLFWAGAAALVWVLRALWVAMARTIH